MKTRSSMPLPDPLRAVIFDMDGTLTRTNELIFASVNHVMQRYLGRTLTPQEIVALFGPPEEGGLARMLDAQTVDAAMEDLCAFYRENHGTLASLHDGIPAILEHLRSSGIRLAVFTGKGRRTARITLDELSIGSYFDMVITGNDVTRHKPDPEGIRMILEEFKVSPRETVMVGDSTADIRAARGAGVTMAAVLWDSYDRERVLAAGADAAFDTTRDLLHWFSGNGAALNSPGGLWEAS